MIRRREKRKERSEEEGKKQQIHHHRPPSRLYTYCLDWLSKKNSKSASLLKEETTN